MNPIEARVGPVRVAVVATNMAFGAEHVARPFNSISLSAGGQPYEPGGAGWIRYTNDAGRILENRQADFSIRHRLRLGFDGEILVPYRAFPTNAIEPMGKIQIGDSVTVDSRRLTRSVSAKVRRVRTEDFTVEVDFPAASGDSGSLVTTRDGRFLGFVSAAIPKIGKEAAGSAISVPPISPIFSAVPTPTPPPPGAPPRVGDSPAK